MAIDPVDLLVRTVAGFLQQEGINYPAIGPAGVSESYKIKLLPVTKEFLSQKENAVKLNIVLNKAGFSDFKLEVNNYIVINRFNP